MRFPWQDRDPIDGKPDDYPLDTWTEIFVAWGALMLTLIAALVLLGYLAS